MAKAVILDVLNNTIGKYVLNLDTSSLNVAVWKGTVELRSLDLDSEAINRELALRNNGGNFIPFRVVRGHIQTLQIDVPWTRITSRPVVFRAKDCNIILEPFNHSKYTSTSTTSNCEARREQELNDAESSRQRINAVKKLANMKEDEIESVDQEKVGNRTAFDNPHSSINVSKREQKKKKKSSSLIGNLARRILENLQIEIEHVHLAIKGSDAIIGIVLKAFNITSTDKNGNKKFIDRYSSSNINSKRDKEKIKPTSSFLHKALQIEGLGIYCDDQKSYQETSPIDSIFDESSPSQSFMLSPTSFQTRLRRSDNSNCKGSPQYHVTSHLSTVSVVVRRSQLDLINSTITQSIEGNDSNPILPLFPEYRPSQPIERATAKMWWKYAVRCIGRLNRRRSWAEFFIAFKKRKLYIDLYSRFIYNPRYSWLLPLKKIEKETLTELEMDQSVSVFGIMIWRNIADIRTGITAERFKVKKNYDRANSGAGQSKQRWRISPKKTLRPHRKHKGYQLKENESEDIEQYTTGYENEILLMMSSTEYLNLLKSELYRESVESTNSTSFELIFTLESMKADFITLNMKKLGLFSMELTDIKVSKLPASSTNENTTFEESQRNTYIHIDTNFTTLNIDWNPNAVKELLFFKNNIESLHDEFTKTHEKSEDKIDMLSQTTSPRIKKENIKRIFSDKREESLRFMLYEKNLGNETLVVVLLNARMQSLEINLNSAKDDLPLFLLAMAGSQVKAKLCSGNKSHSGLLMSGVVDDFRMETASCGQVRTEYKTILGLAPNQTTSLLKVEYGKGSIGLRENIIENIDHEKCEAVAKYVLSPMRFVYIHAQIKTLIEYVTQGVLGALTARMASSVAAAAIAISQKNIGEKTFVIEATGFDFIIPTSMHSTSNLTLHSGDLFIRYTSLLNPGEGEANLILENVTMLCDKKNPLIDVPIKMTINAILMPTTAPTAEERFMRFKVLIECVSFLLSKSHYAQIRETFDSNIGEKNSFLRDTLTPTKKPEMNYNSTEISKGYHRRIDRLTHGGVIFSEIIRRTYIEFTIQTFSLELKPEGTQGSLLCLTALETCISISLIPDEDERRIDVALRNLECEDRRSTSSTYHFRRLLSQIHRPKINDHDVTTKPHDVFSLSYIYSRKENSKEIIVEFGSSHFFVNADIVRQIFDFFRLSKSKIMNTLALHMYNTNDHLVQIADVLVSDEAGGIETSLFREKAQRKGRKSFSVRSSDSIVTFINTNTHNVNRYNTDLKRSKSQETITLRGEVEVNVSFVVDIDTGINIEKQVEINYSKIEIYTDKWHTLSNPVQVLEPTQVAVFFSSELRGNRRNNDLKLVSLSHMQWILSIHNLALIRDIIQNLKNLFSDNSHEKKDSGDLKLQYHPVQHLDIEVMESKQELANNYPDMPTKGIDTIERDLGNQTLIQRITDMKITLTKAEIVIINDLQGMDEALFKITMTDVLSNGQITLLEELDRETGKKKIDVLFKITSNSLVLANYFNSKTDTWEYFLTEPWEIILKADRRLRRANRDRFTTSFDVESLPCKISFSEQFLISVGAAISMWKTYINARPRDINRLCLDSFESAKMKVNEFNPNNASNNYKSVNDDNSLEIIMPYMIRNDSAIKVELLIKNGRSTTAWDHFVCESCTEKYFSFNTSPCTGSGTMRLYGQDSNFSKEIYLMIMDHDIYLQHIDYEINQPRRVCKIDSNNIIIIDITKASKTTLIHVSSNVYLSNQTNIDFQIYDELTDDRCSIGVFKGLKEATPIQHFATAKLKVPDIESKCSDRVPHQFVGVPLKLRSQTDIQEESTSIFICPKNLDPKIFGLIIIPSLSHLTQIATSSSNSQTLEAICKPLGQVSSKESEDLVVIVRFDIKLISQSYPIVELTLLPRLSIRNTLCVDLFLKTKQRSAVCVSSSDLKTPQLSNEVIHVIKPFEEIQIFNSGEVFSFLFTTTYDEQVTETEEVSWVTIPIGTDQNYNRNNPYHTFYKSYNSEFLIIESNHFWENLRKSKDLSKVETSDSKIADVDCPKQSEFIRENKRTLLISANCVSFDHTEMFLFEHFYSDHGSSTLSKTKTLNFYSSSELGCNVSILQSCDEFYRLIKKSDKEMRTSVPFRITDIILGDGGIKSSPIQWKGNKGPDCFIYGNLSNHNQIQIHVIPKFTICNTCNETIKINQQGYETITLLSKGTIPIIRNQSQDDFVLSIQLIESRSAELAIHVQTIGTKLYELRSIGTNAPIGSLAVSIVTGNKKSRYILKIGTLRYHPSHQFSNSTERRKFLADDCLRFRIKWSTLEIILNDTAKNMKEKESENGNMTSLIVDGDKPLAICQGGSRVARIELNGFTVDFQRLFKDEPSSALESVTLLNSSERSQFSIVVHSVEVNDCAYDRKYSDILKCCSRTVPFFDLCCRTRGSDDPDIVKVDLFDLNIANSEGKSRVIIVNGNEEFLWSIIDLASRIIDAIGEISGKKTYLDWNGQGNRLFEDEWFMKLGNGDAVDRSLHSISQEKIYEVRVARFSPISVAFSFKRQPQSSRYKIIKNINTAKFMSFVTSKLKFTINKADLRFEGYVVKNIKGSKNSLTEILKSEYISRLKFKFVEILKATSVDDWKSLTGRDDGDEEYVGGDLLRLTGNLAGRSAGFVLKKVGQGIGDTVTYAATGIGNEIEKQTQAVGAGFVGACMNSVISGVGEGVGNTVKGVGTGSGKIIRGSVQGVGHIVGGVEGGILVTTKGVGDGISNGDGNAICSAFGAGMVTLGTGIERGTGTALLGAADGVVSVGNGVLKGAQSICKGVGEVFTGRPNDNNASQMSMD